MAMVQSAELACRSPPRLSRWRSCLPEEASTGLAPHSAAKLASLRTRPGLSPVVASSVAATWVATLKLGQMLDTLPDRLTLARQQKMAHADFLELVLADEVARREAKSASLRARAAGLDPAMRL